MTPEGKVKQAVKDALANADIRNAKDAGTYEFANGWYYMPSQNGVGVKGIADFVGFVSRGDIAEFFAVETKAPKKEPTSFQELQIGAIRASGGKCFVIDNEDGVKEFEEWLEE